eukprot:GHVN01010365.1.p1 GENE.GHVN01010365.1~~GHVN01010365.1.p1  ORF type:complete len:375 (+),score=16.69 GHVN01010365.1:329-1453(+)
MNLKAVNIANTLSSLFKRILEKTSEEVFLVPLAEDSGKSTGEEKSSVLGDHTFVRERGAQENNGLIPGVEKGTYSLNEEWEPFYLGDGVFLRHNSNEMQFMKGFFQPKLFRYRCCFKKAGQIEIPYKEDVVQIPRDTGRVILKAGFGINFGEWMIELLRENRIYSSGSNGDDFKSWIILAKGARLVLDYEGALSIYTNNIVCLKPEEIRQINLFEDGKLKVLGDYIYLENEKCFLFGKLNRRSLEGKRLTFSSAEERYLSNFTDEEKITLGADISELQLLGYACKLITRFENLNCRRVVLNCWGEKHLPLEDRIILNGRVSELSLCMYACNLRTHFENLDNVNVLENGIPMRRVVFQKNKLSRAGKKNRRMKVY